MADTTQMDAAAFTGRGTERERVSLPGDLFDGTVNVPVMHQAVKAFLANQRQGTASTKTRGKVAGGNQKPWRQKGTGRARQGSTRAPNWVGGGTVFGPSPRSYTQAVPKQVKALARKSALNARAREGALLVVDRFEFDAPRTSRMAELMHRLGLDGQKVLVLTDGAKTNVFLSARNLPTVHVMPYSDVSTYHVLWSDSVVIEASAIGHTLEPITEAEEPEKERKARPAATKKTKGADKPKREAAAKKAPAKKTTARKGAAKKSSAKKSTARKSTARKSTAKKSTAKKSTARKSGSKSTKKKGR